MKVAVIGLGRMGHSAALVVQKSGTPVIGFDVDSGAIKRAGETGIPTKERASDAVNGADVILLSLPRPEHVRQALTGGNGLLAASAKGSVIVDLSTVGPSFSREMAALSAEKQIGYLDAPVLGRPNTCGRWTLPVGGDTAHFERARPIVQMIAANIPHVGPSGAGSALKLLNNLMVGAINSVTAEILAACPRVGIEPALFVKTVADSGAASVSNLFRELGPKIVARDFSPTFTVDLLHKDTGLAVAMLTEAKAPSMVANTVQLLNDMTRLAGYGGQDISAVTRVYEDLMQVQSNASA